MPLLIERLEQYTLNHPQEVLLIQCLDGDTPDEILVFKGYSSSTMRPTAFDLDTPVLPESAAIQSITRLKAPYDPNNPVAIESDITWEDFQSRLDKAES